MIQLEVQHESVRRAGARVMEEREEPSISASPTRTAALPVPVAWPTGTGSDGLRLGVAAASRY